MVDVLLDPELEDEWMEGWKWPKFMQDIAGWEEVPMYTKPRTLAYRKYVDYRRQIIRHMNRELAARGDCRRLRIKPGTGDRLGGVYWCTRDQAVLLLIPERLHRILATDRKSDQYYKEALMDSKLPQKHKEMVKTQINRILRASNKKTEKYLKDTLGTKLLPSTLEDA